MRQPAEAANTAIVIVGQNERYWIRACIESALKETPAKSIYYVDNASRDGTAEYVVSAFPGIHIVKNSRNRGFAAGNNQVLRQIMNLQGFDYVFLLNPDAVVPSGLLAALREFVRNNPQYGIVGPLQVEYDGIVASHRLNRVSRRDLRIGRFHILRRWIDDFPLRVAHDHPVGVVNTYYVQGSALFCSVSVLREVGIFDEIFHSFFEEVDLCRRALWHGYKVGLLTNWRLPHASRGAGNRSRWRIYLRLRNKYLFALTDADISLGHLPSIVVRLVLQDFRRMWCSRTLGDFSTVSFACALAWLFLNTPKVVACRRRRVQVRRSAPRCSCPSSKPQ